MADTNPTDLQIVPQPNTDKNYFNFKATNLKIDEDYYLKFQWVYADGTLSEWSPGYFIHTSTENVPGAPSATVPSTAVGSIPVTLSVFPQNALRVDIYIIGGVFGTGKVADSFFSAGTKNISVSPGVYQVSLITVTPSGINGDPTNTFTITISSEVAEDTTAPDPIASGITTGGVHPQDPSGQLGYLNAAITNGTIPDDFAGYIAKIVGPTNTWNQVFDSKVALSNLYLTGGLFVGQSYTVSVATTDGKNVSDYVTCSPTGYTITDTRSNSSTVTGSLSFSATDSILTVSWTGSSDAYVDSYRVQLTSNADTSFASPLQTVFSKGTTATFGGLDSNTTYRIRVTTKYGGATGALSTNHTTGTVTLNASGAISDGIAPTSNPALTSDMVKSLFGAFAITFPPITNADAVTYEVFIKPTSSTGIVHADYKVLEVGGTFAVIKTLADRTTALSYGTNYYIAVRAKDNDGVSTGTVTPVGPVQTLQVQNDDLAADSVYANNIKAGVIDASKLTSDTILANQKITVGSNSSLDRVRLDATDATIGGSAVSSRIYIGGGNYYDTASPFYADNLGRISIGQGLKFESGALTINGSGTFTGTVTAGAGANSIKLGNDVNSTNDGIYIGATGDYIYTDGRLRLGNGGILFEDNTLTVEGDITANALSADAEITSPIITGGTYQTSINAGNGSTAGVRINTSGIYAWGSSSATANFSVTNTGILSALAGTIGGWDINGTQLRSTGTNSITLNPLTPKIALLQSGVEKITIDPVEGIKDGAGNFTLTPSGTLTLKGSIEAGSTIKGSTLTGSNLYIGETTSATSYILSNGNFALGGAALTGTTSGVSLGGGQLTATSSSVTISGANLVLSGLSGGDDGTAGDPTVVRIINPAGLGGTPDGKIVTGRAIWYGGNNTPYATISSRYAYNVAFGASQGFVGGVPRYTSSNPGEFSTGDLYMTLV